jgi:hypothetical protein
VRRTAHFCICADCAIHSQPEKALDFVRLAKLGGLFHPGTPLANQSIAHRLLHPGRRDFAQDCIKITSMVCQAMGLLERSCWRG